MLHDKQAIANIAVKDITAAAKFYEETLDLRRLSAEGEELITYQSGDSQLNVYRSDYAGSNKATAVTWVVGDQLEVIVHALNAKGVVFEHYDLPGVTCEGDIHLCGDMKVAWFKDPDGNILNLVNR
ncbi:MAG: VOC family protein [Pseudomonadota bacterium]